MIYQRDIKEFSEGRTIIGGYTPYEVDIDKDRQLIEITKKVSFSFMGRKEIVPEIRTTFKMPEDKYSFESIMVTKKGIRVRFAIL